MRALLRLGAFSVVGQGPQTAPQWGGCYPGPAESSGRREGRVWSTRFAVLHGCYFVAISEAHRPLGPNYGPRGNHYDFNDSGSNVEADYLERRRWLAAIHRPFTTTPATEALDSELRELMGTCGEKAWCRFGFEALRRLDHAGRLYSEKPCKWEMLAAKMPESCHGIPETFPWNFYASSASRARRGGWLIVAMGRWIAVGDAPHGAHPLNLENLPYCPRRTILVLSAEDDGCTPRCGYRCYMTSKMEDDAGRWSAIVWQNNPVSMFFKSSRQPGANDEVDNCWTIFRLCGRMAVNAHEAPEGA
ncbi:hypothetical protein DFP72DRAFT_843339 [Ephemerocybe angulata]|uniref:Uncharacterized protein n=1 Tax=Ephemerocybe angulata TaxID=980116 RepID=A0A8H6MC35_9AGAR|nr:hypothetical protein DFP72DRAFT_843339 [Tulosesus angulatus]